MDFWTGDVRASIQQEGRKFASVYHMYHTASCKHVRLALRTARRSCGVVLNFTHCVSRAAQQQQQAPATPASKQIRSGSDSIYILAVNIPTDATTSTFDPRVFRETWGRQRLGGRGARVNDLQPPGRGGEGVGPPIFDRPRYFSLDERYPTGD